MSPSTLTPKPRVPGLDEPATQPRTLPPWLVEPEVETPDEVEPETSLAAIHPDPIRVATGFLTVVVLAVAAYAWFSGSPF